MELRVAKSLAEELVSAGFEPVNVAVSAERSNGVAYKATVEVAIRALTLDKVKRLLEIIDNGHGVHTSLHLGDAELTVELT